MVNSKSRATRIIRHQGKHPIGWFWPENGEKKLALREQRQFRQTT